MKPFFRFAFIFLSMVALFIPAKLLAEELDDRFVTMQADQLKAKQNRADETTIRIDAMRSAITQEREEMRKANERLWQEYAQSIEMERKELSSRMSTLDERQRLFEAELDKKQKQDDIRLREREVELKRLMLDLERMRGEIGEDQKQLESSRKEISESLRNNTSNVHVREDYRQSPPSRLQPGGEVLENDSIRITGFRASEIMGEKSFSSKKLRQEYYVGYEDVLDIDVWRVKDLSRKVVVRPDGRISLPLAGDMEVVGLSLVELRELITEKLSTYIKDPQVTISIDRFGGRKFILLGQVKNPGVYRFQSDISLLEGIALAGGFSEQARSGKIMLIRGDLKKEPQVNIISANVENILKRGMLTENLTILPNDIIYVGKDFLGDYRDVLREIVEPAFDNLIDFFVLRSAIRTAQEKGV